MFPGTQAFQYQLYPLEACGSHNAVAEHETLIYQGFEGLAIERIISAIPKEHKKFELYLQGLSL